MLTGGAGYIGTHLLVDLLNAGHNVIVLDNLANSHVRSIRRIEKELGRSVRLYVNDVRDRKALDIIFSTYVIDTVVHLAGCKSVLESVKNPLKYYSNNISATVNLLEAMAKFNVFRLIFSSSCAVYGNMSSQPMCELASELKPISPYGQSKLMVERILADTASSDNRWHIGVLRYFNPVGAHPAGLTGEDSHGMSDNLVNRLTLTATGALKQIEIFGNDYDTPDGTCIRDYLHVMDVANGHLLALNILKHSAGLNIWNLGSGIGYSVLEAVRFFEKATGKLVRLEIVDRRSGDTSISIADIKKAQRELGWRPIYTIQDMMRDAWRWHCRVIGSNESQD